jgi:hypothetical protein
MTLFASPPERVGRQRDYHGAAERSMRRPVFAGRGRVFTFELQRLHLLRFVPSFVRAKTKLPALTFDNVAQANFSLCGEESREVLSRLRAGTAMDGGADFLVLSNPTSRPVQSRQRMIMTPSTMVR